MFYYVLLAYLLNAQLYIYHLNLKSSWAIQTRKFLPHFIAFTLEIPFSHGSIEVIVAASLASLSREKNVFGAKISIKEYSDFEIINYIKFLHFVSWQSYRYVAAEAGEEDYGSNHIIISWADLLGKACKKKDEKPGKYSVKRDRSICQVFICYNIFKGT